MHLLSRTIDGTVGKQLIFHLIILLLIIAGTGEVDILGRRKLISRCVDQYLPIHIFEVSLALGICRHSGMDESLELARLVVIASVIEHNLRTRNRLTVCSIHHHIAMPVIRQLLDHHRQITDIEEQTLRSDAGIVRSHLHQIGAQRQIATDFDGILHLFVIRTTIIAFAEILLVQLRGLLQEHLIGSLILDIIFIIRRDVETGNDHL